MCKFRYDLATTFIDLFQANWWDPLFTSRKEVIAVWSEFASL